MARNPCRFHENVAHFSNCLGAIDRERNGIQPPKDSGFLYYNYKKKTFSILLLAIEDTNYKFILKKICDYGNVIFNTNIDAT